MSFTLEITFDCATATPLKVTFKYKFMKNSRINFICY